MSDQPQDNQDHRLAFPADSLTPERRRELQDELIHELCTHTGPRAFSLRSWARGHDITEQAVSKWLGTREFQGRWMSYAKRLGYNPTKYLSVVEAMHQSAIEGNVAAARLWLQVMQATPTFAAGAEADAADDTSLDVALLTTEQLEEQLAMFGGTTPAPPSRRRRREPEPSDGPPGLKVVGGDLRSRRLS